MGCHPAGTPVAVGFALFVVRHETRTSPGDVPDGAGMSIPFVAVVTAAVLVPARAISLPVGCGATVMVEVAEDPGPEPLAAVSVTVYTPGVVKVCDGFWAPDVPPSPKVQAQLVGLPVEVSVSWTVSGTVPDVVLAVKEDVGAGGAARWRVWVLDDEPVTFVAVSVTV
jgi:hypothetical protein